MSVKIEVWGDYGLFTRPEMKVERISYDVMTPSAARGIVESVFWHPGLAWYIDKIYVLSPIEFTNIRRNEVKSKASSSKARTVMNGGEAKLFISSREDIQQRTAMVLRNPRYVISAHFEMTSKANNSDNEGKFQEIVKRRLKKGQCYHNPYLGCREFPAKFKLYEGTEVPTVYADCDKDLGYMLYDMDYSDPKDIKPLFFRAVLKKGVLDLTDCEVHR
ncbi:MAG: type I-C CRISPR-associated protein Cas5c [Phascolarctobacterium sp.]|uniref:type I-C CRISPR-associated protein Cas5c n=1 Tax=Phascolarctobacterium sp. TaxID=2049039 RepID=UPI0025F1F7DE|nr:type I-C CRISPR-associated protein Cas5c [Phascolarctobacterium sp.]MCC8159106.1 type I-C CRISPR-associated protein Cas5c [Phascolarctobacterium sp.]